MKLERSLTRMQSLTRMNSQKKLLRRKSFERTNSLVLAGRGLKQHMLDALIYSLAAYESTPEKVLAVLRCKYEFPVAHLEVVPWEELSTDDPGPQPLLIGRSVHGQYYVACRGTADFADVMTDLKFIHKRLPFAKGSAHLGFVQRAASVNIEPFLTLLRNGHKIVFTGHSLGGAVASLLGLRVLEEAAKQGCCPHQRRVQVITFGAPLFADAGLAELINMEYRELYHHIVSKNDLVPRILPLIAFGHRLIGGEPHHLAYLRLGRMALELVENITKWPVASTLRAVESHVPGTIRNLASLALRIFWPGEADHQYSFAGQIVVVDRTELAMDKAVRLTKAEELNFWCSQLGFGLGLHVAGIAEHGLANYQKVLAADVSSRLAEYLAKSHRLPEKAAASAVAAGAELGGAMARKMAGEEGGKAKDYKMTLRCKVGVEEERGRDQAAPSSHHDDRQRRVSEYSDWSRRFSECSDYDAVSECDDYGGRMSDCWENDRRMSECHDFGKRSSESSGMLTRRMSEGSFWNSSNQVSTSAQVTDGGATVKDEGGYKMLVKRQHLNAVGSSKCLHCARVMKVYAECEVVVEGELPARRRRRIPIGKVVGTVSQIVRTFKFDKLFFVIAAARFVMESL